MILIGVDQNGAHLYYITDPGTSSCLTPLGFCSIGSGEPHAENSLISNHFSKRFKLKEAIYLSYEAKRRSQVSPGVGEYTNIAFIDDKKYHFISDKTIKDLSKLFDVKEKDLIEPAKEMIKNMIKDIKIITG